PLLQALGRFALRRLLLRRRRLAPSPAAATAAPARGRAGETLGRTVHQLDLTDARFEDVPERGLGALVGHAAVAVRDRPDADAADHGVRVWGLTGGSLAKVGLRPAIGEYGGRKRGERQRSNFASRIQHGRMITISFIICEQ